MDEYIQDILDKLSPNSYMVGGAVRDIALKKIPNDIDITTDLLPDEILEVFPDGNVIGKRFGTVIVNTEYGPIDITTMRKDITPGVHPDVAFTNDLHTDLARRDFTINAMAMDIDGNFIDPFKGLYDCHFKFIRAVGNPKIRIQVEDPRRAFRAARIATQTKFTIIDNLRCAIFDVDITDVDGDFIQSELRKGLMSNPRGMIENLFNLNLLAKFMPEILCLIVCEHNLKHHPEGGAFEHTLYALEHSMNATFEELVAILLHDIGKARTKVGLTYRGHAGEGVIIASDILKRLKFSKDDTKRILFCIENHMKMHVISDMRKAKRYALYDNPYFNSLLTVHVADSHGRDNMSKFVAMDIPARMPERLVTGHDLIKLGFTADKTLGPILKELYEIQIEEGIKSKEIILEYL